MLNESHGIIVGVSSIEHELLVFVFATVLYNNGRELGIIGPDFWIGSCAVFIQADSLSYVWSTLWISIITTFQKVRQTYNRTQLAANIVDVNNIGRITMACSSVMRDSIWVPSMGHRCHPATTQPGNIDRQLRDP